MFTTTKVNSFFPNWRLRNRLFHFPWPRPLTKTDITSKSSREWVRTISFLDAFSHTCPKGARITDTTTFHWGKWDQSVLHGLDSGGKRGSPDQPVFVGRLHRTHVSRQLEQNTREWKPECYKCSKVTRNGESVCYNHIQDIPSKSGAQQLYQEVCCSFVFLLFRAVFVLWMGPASIERLENTVFMSSPCLVECFNVIASFYSQTLAHAKMWKLTFTKS